MKKEDFLKAFKIVMLISFVSLFTSSCKEPQPELRELTRDQMQQMIIDRQITMPRKLPYYSEDGSLVSENLGSAELANPISTTWFINDKNELVHVQILDISQGLAQLQKKPLVADLNTVDCTNLKSVLNRLFDRMLMENEDSGLTELLQKQNTEALEHILKTCGFPTSQTAGEDGMQTVWSLLQDASKETRTTYFPAVIEASKNGDLERQDVALMQDKLLMDYGKPQLYGSQVLRNDNGIFELYKLENPSGVDARRAIMGMTPLAEYLTHFKIDFNVNQKK